MASRRCAVLDKPVAHSLSPVLHNAAYRSLKPDDWLYDKHEMGEDDLDTFPRGFDSTWAGLSLAMPLKKITQPYGVPRDLWAEELKVVNTTTFDWSMTADDPAWSNGKPGIKLYNTDVIDIQPVFDHTSHELSERHTASRSDTALIVDNDSTITSVLIACCMMPEIGHIVAVTRHPGENTGPEPVAERLVNVYNPYNEIELGDDQALLEATRNATYVISTILGYVADSVADALTDAGTKPFSRLPLDVACDPRLTKLMEAWRAHSGHAIDGGEMLLYQALVQVLPMTGIWDNSPPNGADQRLQDTTTEDDRLEIAMRKTLEEAL